MFPSPISGRLSVFILVGTLVGTGSAKEPSRFEFVETHMGSSFRILLYSTDEATARRASRAAYDRVAVLDSVLSDYEVDSEISRLSRRAGDGAVEVGADLFDVLEKAKHFYERSDGAFDPTVAPVGRLWRRAMRDRKLPDPVKLAEARALVGADKMILDPSARTVRLSKPGMRLDVGGIAKGYAAQAAIDVLREHGVTRALVAGAGDVVVGDPPSDSDGWVIGVASLYPSTVEPKIYLSLRNQAVSTAGDAERFVVIDGRRYSHIINPVTGMAVEDRASVTVIAPDGASADALETAVYLLGPEKGFKLIDETPGAAAIFTRETPKGIQYFESSRFQNVPRAEPKK